MSLSPDLYTPWIRACTRGQVSELEAMAQGEPWPDLQCRTPQTSCLLLAAANGHTEVCRRLLAHNPHLEARNQDNKTPLLWAAEDGRDAVVKLLLDHGADILAKDNRGRTPLMVAARGANTQVVHALLHQAPKGYVNEADSEEMTALQHSCHVIDTSIMEELLKQGANPNHYCGQDCSTVLDYATSLDHDEHIRLLVQYGAKVNRKKGGRTALHTAVERENEECVRALVDCGANPDMRDNDGRTPRELAEAQQWDGLARVLAEMQQGNLDASTPAVEKDRRAMRL